MPEPTKLHDTQGTVVEDGCYVKYTPEDSAPVIGLVSNTDVFHDTVAVNYPVVNNTTLQDTSVVPEESVLVVMNADGTLVVPTDS